MKEDIKNASGNIIGQVKVTPNYGNISQTSNFFDDKEFFNSRFLDYKLHKIVLWYGKAKDKQIVKGIQFFYKERGSGKIVTPGENRVATEPVDGKEELELEPGEYINDFIPRFGDLMNKITFKTNKGRILTVGTNDDGEEKITQLAGEGYIILGSFGSYCENYGSLGLYIMYYADYSKMLFFGIFTLRYLIKKKEDFKKEWDQKCKSLEKSECSLYKVCTLDDINFLNVMKFMLC